MPVLIESHAQSYSVQVVHPCRHVYRSDVRWNTESAAKRHGQKLLACACSVCRDSRRAPRKS